MSETLGAELLAARERAFQAEREFRELVREALDSGASLRNVAGLLGMSHSTLWRWAGGKRRNPLEQPRRQP